MALLDYDDITLILYCNGAVRPEKLALCEKKYGQVVLIYASQQDSSTSRPSWSHATIVSERAHNKVAALNEAISRAECSHILWLEDDETISAEPVLQRDRYYIAQILEVQADNPIRNRQIRLFPNREDASLSLDGFRIPDIFNALKDQGLKVAKEELSIRRESSLFSTEAIHLEVQEKEVGGSSMENFWLGMQATEMKKFNYACKYFKKALAHEDLPTWNALAAINSLANALMETQDLENAKETAEHSLSVSKNQRAPYLIIYQYYNFKGEQEKKYQILSDYRKKADKITAANWDVYLPNDQVAFLMAEISYHEGWHDEAYQEYKRFYEDNKGNVSRYVLEKLFIYAIELDQRNEAINYFKELFGDYFIEQMTKKQSETVLEALSLFTDNGYYDFACEVYSELSSCRPEDRAIRNGWVRTLIRKDDVKKAQALI